MLLFQGILFGIRPIFRVAKRRVTGLHVTADEADAWFAVLEQGTDIEPPECHV